MAALANLVGFTTNTTGTATTLAVVAAIQGLRTPAGAALADGQYSYGIETGAAGSEQYECGTITIGSSGASITGRTMINSTTGSLLSLSGTSKVYITDLAGDHPVKGAIAPTGPVTLTAAESGQPYNTGATSRAFTVSAGIPLGFDSVYVDGPCTWVAAGGVTVTDSRQTGQTYAACALVQTGTNTFRLVGTTT